MLRGLETRNAIEISRHSPPGRVKDMIIPGGRNVFTVEERIAGFKRPRFVPVEQCASK